MNTKIGVDWRRVSLVDWRRVSLAIVCGLVFAWVSTGSASAFEGIAVDSTEITAKKGDSEVTAEIRIINTSRERVTLSGASARAGCSPKIVNGIAEPSQSTTVTIKLEGNCFPTSSETLTLRFAEPVGLPTLTVSAPVLDSDWGPARIGMIAGGIASIVVLAVGWIAYRGTQETPAGSGAGNHLDEYEKVKKVDDRIADLGTSDLDWKEFPPKMPPPYSFWKGSISGLDASWSLQDSLVSNLTIGTTAFVALVTSIDAATALFGAKPAAALRVMVVVGLMSAVIIALAVLTTKVLPPGASEVSPFSLALSAAMVVGAATMQTVAVGSSTVELLATNPTLSRVAWTLTVLIVTLTTLYGWRMLWTWIRKGAPAIIPKLPPDALTAWQAKSAWEKVLVDQRIRAMFKDWLNTASHASVDFVYPDWSHYFGSRTTSFGDGTAERPLGHPSLL